MSYEFDAEKFHRENQAPEGQIWVCRYCGKHNTDRMKVGDESCYLNAVLCHIGGPPWEAIPPKELGA